MITFPAFRIKKILEEQFGMGRVRCWRLVVGRGGHRLRRPAGQSEMFLIRHKRQFCELYEQLNPDLPPPNLGSWERAYPHYAKASKGSCRSAKYPFPAVLSCLWSPQASVGMSVQGILRVLGHCLELQHQKAVRQGRAGEGKAPAENDEVGATA